MKFAFLNTLNNFKNYITNHNYYGLIYVFINYYLWYFVVYRVHKLSDVKIDYDFTAIYVIGLLLSYISMFLIALKYRVIHFIFSFVVIYSLMFLASYVSVVGWSFSQNTLDAIYQTNIAESYEYLLMIFDKKIFNLFTLFFFIIFLASFLKVPNNFKKIKSQKNINLLNYGVFVLIFIIVNSDSYSSFFTKRIEAFQQFEEYDKIADKVFEFRKNNTIKHNLTSSDELNLVIIIGESATRNNMSLYGYEKQTTPYMDKRNVIKFNDVISPHSHTDPSLSQALTLANHARGRYFIDYDSYSVIELLKHSGFDTYWISNQSSSGLYDNKVADISTFFDDKFIFIAEDESNSSPVYDEAVVPYVKKQLNKSISKNALFVHLAGSHSNYNKRYPKNYKQVEKWNKDKLGVKNSDGISEYDTSIKYTDYVIEEIYKIVDKQTKPTVVLYFSDHGENPFNLTGHHSDTPSYGHLEIPFVVYANKKYNQVYSQKINSMKNNVNKPYSIVDLTYSILDLAMVKGLPHTNERSIFNKDFLPVSRTAFTGNNIYNTNPIDYDNQIINGIDYFVAKKNIKNIKNRFGAEYSNKIMPHRTNTIMQLKMSKQIFNGIEVDVVYDNDKNIFQIGHPPVKFRDFSLEEYLQYVPKKSRIWIDWKNATESNIDYAVERLNYLNNKYHIKKRVIIETPKQFKEISNISDNGYHQSYYLPTGKISRCSQENIDCSGIASEIINNIEQNKFDAISFDVVGYNFYEKHLKQYITKTNKSVHVWDMQNDISSSEFRISNIFKYLNDKNIKSIIVQYSTDYGYNETE